MQAAFARRDVIAVGIYRKGYGTAATQRNVRVWGRQSPEGADSMRIAVTGATGYIGSHLVSAFCRKHEVYAIVRTTSETAGIQAYVKEFIVYDSEQVYGRLAAIQPEVLIHLAGVFYGEHTADNIENLLNANLVFSTVVFDAAVSAGCKKIINTGTYWQQFAKEDYNPVNLYAATKQAAEDILMYYVKARRCSAVTLQIFDSYGPDDNRKKILNIIRELEDGARIDMSGGRQKMYYCHIEDLVSGYARALELLAEMAPGTAVRYALREEEPVMLRTLIEEFLRIQGKRLEINWGGRAYRDREIMEPAGIGTVLPGWTPRYSWQQGVETL